ELIAAFKSTLEEVVLADVLLHVHDCASPVAPEEAQDVTQVLYQLGMTEEEVKTRVIHVFNKCDLLATPTKTKTQSEITAKLGEGVFVSATTGEGLEALSATLDHHFAQKEHRLTIAIPFASNTSGKARAWLYQHGAVLDVTQDDHAASEYISVLLSPANLARFTRLYPDTPWHQD
ncbi:MAG: GTPase HflX, partial [Proteobacteria bacterium]|nr:GTPase HflX [Pseudomonadota bacterium]